MDYCTLGRSGLRVSRLNLGAMTFGTGTGIWQSIAALDREQTTRLVALAVERGVNLIDTADAYSQGQSEQRVGEALTALGLDESRMLVATKVRLRTGPGPNDVGLGRSHILRAVETSLKRIGRDHVDLLQLHDRDALVPLAETCARSTTWCAKARCATWARAILAPRNWSARTPSPQPATARALPATKFTTRSPRATWSTRSPPWRASTGWP